MAVSARAEERLEVDAAALESPAAVCAEPGPPGAGAALLTPAGALALQRAAGNQAVARALRAGAAPPGLIQRFRESRMGRVGRVSGGGQLILTTSKVLYATSEAIDASRTALSAVGALVTLAPAEGVALRGKSFPDLDAQFRDREYRRVVPAINGPAVAGKLWERLKQKQPGGSFRTYADCYRTGMMAAGLNPAGRNQAEKLPLPGGAGGDVPVMSGLKASEAGTASPAARAAASFFEHALPRFKTMLESGAHANKFPPIVGDLARYERATGKQKLDTGHAVYRVILENEEARQLFVKEFGINEFASAEIGQALTQVNDPQEKAEGEQEGKDLWNFHWAGVVMKDGPDYVTLENCAIELAEMNEKELAENADFALPGGNLLPSKKFMTKQDIISDRWYFQMYGAAEQSFHSQNVENVHATPSAITLPVAKA